MRYAAWCLRPETMRTDLEAYRAVLAALRVRRAALDEGHAIFTDNLQRTHGALHQLGNIMSWRCEQLQVCLFCVYFVRVVVSFTPSDLFKIKLFIASLK
jgi:hypothetical protein